MKVLFLGTSSGAGKTTVCAMVCRYLSRIGKDPVPFKGSNLSLNSFATADGGEIGIGQAFQSWAAGVEAHSDMNPVLLKPAGNGVIQLMLDGRPCRDVTKDDPMTREEVMDHVTAALGRLESSHGIVICEGSGSPAELNLLDRDVANTGLMRAANVPAVLVADIDRGGVFAAIYGTWRLVPDDVRPLLKGFVINRFRGEPSILKSGIDKMEELTGMRCLGILPYEFLRFPEEDSLSYSEGKMEGEDPRSAFLANLDEMVDHAIENGFDFDLLQEIAKGRSSARGHAQDLDPVPIRQHGVHRDRTAVHQVQVRVRVHAQAGHRRLYGDAESHLALLSGYDQGCHATPCTRPYLPFDAPRAQYAFLQ